MKKVSFIGMALMLSLSVTAQVAINTDGSNADASAMLDVKSPDKGLLIPRMTNAGIQTISAPANGLLVYSTDDNKIYCYHSGGNEWKEVLYGTGTLIPIVTNPTTGEIWMDRNLGASQVATSSTDATAYGDLYQWGRLTDGHEDRGSGTTTTLSSTDDPGHGNFILVTSTPYDWRSPQNDNLWQGVSGINNPCPGGFRLPTDVEWDAERLSWAPNNNAAGAYGSSLKLTVGGYRGRSNGLLYGIGNSGSYWSGTISGSFARVLYFNSSNATINNTGRANGMSVRCIKD